MVDNYLNKYDENSGGKPYFTASQIVDFLECGVYFRKRHIERLPGRAGSAAAVGTSCHYAENEQNLRQKIKSKVDVPLDVVQDAFADKMEDMKSDIEWDEDEKSMGARKALGKLKDEGVGIITVLHNEVVPGIQPISIEQVIKVPLKDFPRDLMGTWDVEVEKGILDFKIKGKTPAQKDADTNTGLTIYSLSKSVKDSKLPEFAALMGVVRLKKPKAFMLKTTRTREDFDRILLTVGKIQSSVDSGIYLPASPLGWKCSSKWCPYYNKCKERIWSQ